MTIAAELHKTEDDLAHWHLDRGIDWMAFFQIRAEQIKRDTKRNQPLMTDAKATIVEHL